VYGKRSDVSKTQGQRSHFFSPLLSFFHASVFPFGLLFLIVYRSFSFSLKGSRCWAAGAASIAALKCEMYGMCQSGGKICA